MEAYFEAKTRLFTGLAEQTKKKGKAVINLDDRYGAQLVQRFGKETAGHHLRRRRARRFPREQCAHRFQRHELPARCAAAAATSCACRSSGSSTSTTRSPPSPRRTRMGVDVRSGVLALANAPRRARPPRGRAGAAAVPRLRRLRAHRRRAAQCHQDLPRAESRAAHRRLRLRRQSRSRPSVRGWARSSISTPTSPSSPPTIRARKIRSRSSRTSSPA